MATRRKALLAGLTGQVIDIGAGTGALKQFAVRAKACCR